MARARNIKPGFFLNEELGVLPPLVRILFAGLWCIADRDGRLEDRPKRIKMEVLPYDDCDVDMLLDILDKSGFIKRYEEKGIKCIQILNFSKHQHPHYSEKPSILPCPRELLENSGRTPRELLENSGRTPSENLNMKTDSLNLKTDSLNLKTESPLYIPPQGGGDFLPEPSADFSADCLPEPLTAETAEGGQEAGTFSTALTGAAFEQFWAAYPRKVGRSKCRDKFKALVKKGIPPDVIVAGAVAYAAWCERNLQEPQYIAHPQTWLNRGGWEDELVDYKTPLSAHEKERRAARERQDMVFAALQALEEGPADGFPEEGG